MSHSRVHTSYVAIGSKNASLGLSRSTLTATFANNQKVLFCKYLEKLHLDINYVPQDNNAYVSVLVEFSNDETTEQPSNWFPVGAQTAGTTEIDQYTDSGTGMGTASGLPVIVPGDKTTTANVVVKAGLDFNFDMNANWVRISAIETNSGNFGSVFVEATISS